MNLIPSLLVTSIVLMVIGLAIALFQSWSRDPVVFQRRAGLVFKILLRIITVPIFYVVALSTLILSLPMLMASGTVKILGGKSATVSVKIT